MWTLARLKRLREHAPFTWSGKRKLLLSLAIVLALLAYPVLITLALWTGFVSGRSPRKTCGWEIKIRRTPSGPGKVHMKNVRILANGTTQFILEGQDLALNCASSSWRVGDAARQALIKRSRPVCGKPTHR